MLWLGMEDLGGTPRVAERIETRRGGLPAAMEATGAQARAQQPETQEMTD